MELEARDKKLGMSLGELLSHVDTFKSLTEANNANPDDVKVKVMVNMSAGIKSITVEV